MCAGHHFGLVGFDFLQDNHREIKPINQHLAKIQLAKIKKGNIKNMKRFNDFNYNVCKMNYTACIQHIIFYKKLKFCEIFFK